MTQEKPFPITKLQVWEAWKSVKANQGAAGVDGQSLAMFAENLENNLYKLWNRMASGSYMPQPVLRVEIPKADGGVRPLGIPTVADRVAQTVVKMALEPELEAHFHPDSYGYRPGKSAHQALQTARQRCWQYDWVLDLDIKSFFDTLDHDLLLKAVRHHCPDAWVLLYTERWLKAPVAMPDGSLQERDKGTPQGGVASPIYANLYLHYAFDMWMKRRFPAIPFERYADDAVCHCRTEHEAESLKAALRDRLAECGLALHPDKTKVVYCRDSNRRRRYPQTSFDFLGYEFRARKAANRWGTIFTSFSPAISAKAVKRIRATIKGWKLHLRTTHTLEELAWKINPIVGGWIEYYGAFNKSALAPIFNTLERRLEKWASRKYKRRSWRRTSQWFARIRCANPSLFAHWRFLSQQAWAGRAV